MTRILGFVSLIGLVLALVVHCLTFLQVDVMDRFPYVWWLHGGCFIVGLPLVLMLRKKFGHRPKPKQLRAALPRWAGNLLIVAFAYAILNFGLFFFLSEGGAPAIRNGQYVLQNHGKIIRVLSESEYHTQKSYVMRAFSGHWIVFYLTPALFFLFAFQPGTPGVIDTDDGRAGLDS
jgi:hypothetical protein